MDCTINWWHSNNRLSHRVFSQQRHNLDGVCRWRGDSCERDSDWLNQRHGISVSRYGAEQHRSWGVISGIFGSNADDYYDYDYYDDYYYYNDRADHYYDSDHHGCCYDDCAGNYNYDYYNCCGCADYYNNNDYYDCACADSATICCAIICSVECKTFARSIVEIK